MGVRIYAHRVNTLEGLRRVPSRLGIEIDLRSDGSRVIVTHDPFTEGPTIQEFFPAIGARPCIFNVKCEGIEATVREVAASHGISDYFFLDLSVPAAAKLARSGERRLAVRYSELEPVEAVMAWRGLADWVWVDCFTRYPEASEAWARIAASFRVCLVSPELQGHRGLAGASIRRGLAGRAFHAVCTGLPESWQDVEGAAGAASEKPGRGA